MSSSHEIEIGGNSPESSGNNSIAKMDLQDGPTEKPASNAPDNSNMGKLIRVLKAIWKPIKANLLVILTILGCIIGFVLAVCLKKLNPPLTPREIMYLKFPGQLFLRMLKCLTIPLIFSSLVAAIGGLDISLSGRIGGRAIVYYMITVIIAVTLGVFLALILRPGGNTSYNVTNSGTKDISHPADGMLDLIRNMFPPNIIEATMKQYKTTLIDPNPCTPPGSGCASTPIEDMIIKEVTVDAVNILGIVAFAVFLGIALGVLQKKGKPALYVFVSLSDSMLVITSWVIWTSPVGICSLVAAQLLEEKEIGTLLESMGKYVGTVVLGHFIHGLIILPGIYMLFTRKLPFRFLANMTPALCTAFGTSSSAAALPQTIQCLEKGNGVDRRITRFLAPIGTTINMDGAALYEAVAVIFIAQLRGQSLSVGDIISLSITAAAASVGAAGVPQGGLVTMSIVLYSIGLPGEYVSYVTPIDWLVDRFCTVINVLGDAIGAGLLYSMNKDHLHELDILAEEERIATASRTTLAEKKLKEQESEEDQNSIENEE